MIKYQSVVLFVKNIEMAKQFYCEYLSMPIEIDMGKNVILKSGITLWEIREDNIILKKVGKKNINIGNKSELYFETNDLNEIYDIIDKNDIMKLHEIHEEPWGQRTIRFYDFDKNIIEIGEELKTFLNRMATSGIGKEELCKKTGMKIEDIEKSIGYKILN